MNCLRVILLENFFEPVLAEWQLQTMAVAQNPFLRKSSISVYDQISFRCSTNLIEYIQLNDETFFLR